MNEIDVLENNISKGQLLTKFEKEIWLIYKNCESAIFLLKLEMASIDIPDDTKVNIDKDHLEYSLPKVNKYIIDSNNLITSAKFVEALLKLRLARNIMAEIYTQIKKRNIAEKRRKTKELGV
jgi:hypothetical protein